MLETGFQNIFCGLLWICIIISCLKQNTYCVENAENDVNAEMTITDNADETDTKLNETPSMPQEVDKKTVETAANTAFPYGYCTKTNSDDDSLQSVKSHCAKEFEKILASFKQADTIRMEQQQKQLQELEEYQAIESYDARSDQSQRILSNVLPLNSKEMQNLLCLKSEAWTEFAHCVCDCRGVWSEVSISEWDIWQKAQCPITKSVSVATQTMPINTNDIDQSIVVDLKLNLCLWLKHGHDIHGSKNNNVEIDWIDLQRKVIQLQTLLHSNSQITLRDLELALNIFHFIIKSIKNSQNELIKYKKKHDKWNLHEIVTKFENNIEKMMKDVTNQQNTKYEQLQYMGQPSMINMANLYDPVTLENNKKLILKKKEAYRSYENALNSIPQIETGMQHIFKHLKDVFKQTDNYLKYFNSNDNNSGHTNNNQNSNNNIALAGTVGDIANSEMNDLSELKDETLNIISHVATNLQKIHNKTKIIAIHLTDETNEHNNNVYNGMNQFMDFRNTKDLYEAREQLKQLDRHCKMLLNEIYQILVPLEEYVNHMFDKTIKIYQSFLLNNSKQVKNINAHTATTHQPSQAPIMTNEKHELGDDDLKQFNIAKIFQNGWNNARQESINAKATQKTDKIAALKATQQTQQLHDEKVNTSTTVSPMPKTTSQSVDVTEITVVETTHSQSDHNETTVLPQHSEEESKHDDVAHDSSSATQDGIFNHPLFYVWSFAIISFITVLSIFASFLVYKSK